VLFIVDGNIKGEYELGKFDDTDESVIKSRERHLNEWLMEMGW
jgi:putative ABC transport system ATP-binding protein